MTSDWQQQTQQMIEEGKQKSAGLVAGGEMFIDADPENGFFRVKLRNIQPPQAMPQLTAGLCWVLANGGQMFNLQVKQHTRQPEEAKGE